MGVCRYQATLCRRMNCMAVTKQPVKDMTIRNKDASVPQQGHHQEQEGILLCQGLLGGSCLDCDRILRFSCCRSSLLLPPPCKKGSLSSSS